MKVLILTGKFGLGHLSAANSVKERIEANIPGCNARVVDFLQYASCGDIIYKAFALLVRRGENVFNHFYHMCDSDGGGFGLPFKTLCFSFFSRLLGEEDPDIIISTLPFTSQLAGRYKKKKGGRFSLVTWITDTALHGEWVAPQTDYFLVPCAGVKESLVSAGVPTGKIFVAGIPVRKEFSLPREAESRKEDGLRRLLVLGGGLGLICEDTGFYSRLNELPHVKTTVICGNNEKMLALLKGRFKNVEAVGFVCDMESYMRKADLALGKPGGVTLFEAIACRLPFLSLRPFLAQEKANARFVEFSGIGSVLPAPVEECISQIEHMLWDGRVLQAARESMLALENALDKDALEHIISKIATDRAAVA